MWFYALPSFSICVHYPFVILVVMCSCLVLLTLIFLALVCPFFITTMEPSFISRIEFFIWSASWFCWRTVHSVSLRVLGCVALIALWIFCCIFLAYGGGVRYNDAASKYRGFTPFCNLFACPHSCDLGPFYALFLLFFGGGGLFPSWQLTTMRPASLYT